MRTTYKLTVNGTEQDVTVSLENTPLLWVLRETLGLKGTKFGCGSGFFGACTVHVTGPGISDKGSRMLSCVISGADVLPERSAG